MKKFFWKIQLYSSKIEQFKQSITYGSISDYFYKIVFISIMKD